QFGADEFGPERDRVDLGDRAAVDGLVSGLPFLVSDAAGGESGGRLGGGGGVPCPAGPLGQARGGGRQAQGVGRRGRHRSRGGRRPAGSPEAAWWAVVACPAALSPSARRAVKAARPSSSGAEVEITPPWSSSRAEGSRSLSLTAESAGRPASGRPTSCRSGPSDRSSSCRPAASAKVGPADEGRTVLRSAGTMPRGSSTTRSARSVTGN